MLNFKAARRASTRVRTIVFTTNNVIFLDKDCVELAKKLVSEKTYELFGRDLNVEKIVNLSTAILGLTREGDDEVIAVMCISNHPNIASIPSWDWCDWFKFHYGIENVTSRNSCWIHLMVYEPGYGRGVMSPMVRLLYRMKNMEYVFMVVPPGVERVNFVDQGCIHILPKGYLNPRTVQTLFMWQRQNYVKKYKIRRAVEEDNDDIVPLIDMFSEKLKDYYGEYYIAEILTRHENSGRQLIVAEFDSVAVAVIGLNENVNYEALNEHFELRAYHGLKKPSEMDELYREPDPESKSQSGFSQSQMDDSEYSKSIVDQSNVFQYNQSETGSSEFMLKDSSSDDDSDYSLMFSPDDVSEDESFLSNIEMVAKKLGEYEEHLTHEIQYYEHHKGSSHDIALAREQYWSHFKGKRKSKYYGSPNAFALEIALAQPAHLASLSHLYEAAFECFPDRDYCVLSQPFALTPPVLHFFMFVPPRPEGTFPNSLYLLHRNSMVGQIAVRSATEEDEMGIEDLLKELPSRDNLRRLYHSSIESPWRPYLCYLLTCEDDIIGMAVLSEFRDSDYLMGHYNISRWMDYRYHRTGCNGLIEYLVVTPVFHKQGRHFLSELHRLSDFSSLYYKTSHKERPMHNSISYMIPVKSRITPVYNMECLQDYPPEEYVLRREDPFSLYLSLPWTSNRRSFEFNTRIVVVGASETALGFLEALYMKQPKDKFVIFHNVTMVNSHSMTKHKVPTKIRDNLLIQKDFEYESFSTMIASQVNIAHGVMTAINRRERYITIDDVSYIPYDFLFLMCGEQFQKNSVRPDVEPKKEYPRNVYVINTELDAVSAIIDLRTIKQVKKGDKIIVYGHFLQALCCIGTLIAYGVPGDQLIYVEPFPPNASFDGVFRHSVDFFNDPLVDEAVMEAIKRCGKIYREWYNHRQYCVVLGVKVYQGYYFHDWVYHKADNAISHVKFESENRCMDLKCSAMFFYIGKSVSPRTFKSIIQAGLVFDGRLIIDAKCRTNDKHIYGAGTLTRYGRHYYADHLIHKYFSRKEIGQKLGLQIREMLLKCINLDHTYTPVSLKNPESGPSRSNLLVPNYVKPLIRYCKLPDGLYYLSIRKPGMMVPLEAALSKGDYGHVLITGDCKNLDRQGYFRLHLNKFRKVETITCLNRSPIEVQNLALLYGKHEQLLNNLLTRFEMVVIRDLFDYFRQPWAYAIYHDRFDSAYDQMDRYLMNAKLDLEKRDELEEMFRKSSCVKELESKLVKFLERNEDFLPMYGTPAKIKKILGIDP
ncbi:unnamed protein product [Brassicogethes aeneus]|uniref:Cilia- and flagella-associated protein 61 N-terminal domain-containing protein n=1 Tax=Brassicogethes aeneus TaxID=1431903 RepID=A0A9P0AXG9_BRAAE|nr:unnamed protein product [Brassicogethes aeneus]